MASSRTFKFIGPRHRPLSLGRGNTSIVNSRCAVSDGQPRLDTQPYLWEVRAIAPNCFKVCTPMKNQMRTFLAAAIFTAAGMAMAQAADIAAMTGHAAKLDANSSALVYYTAAPDGFHVVVTTQQGRTDQAAVARFETVLAAGQSAAVSIPRAAGEAPARIVRRNARGHLHTTQPKAAVSAP